MNDLRTVVVSREDIETIEVVGKRLTHDAETLESGLRLLALALTWRAAGQRVFSCDVDESAGLAEANVVELLGYSRKAPCS